MEMFGWFGDLIAANRLSDYQEDLAVEEAAANWPDFIPGEWT